MNLADEILQNLEILQHADSREAMSGAGHRLGAFGEAAVPALTAVVGSAAYDDGFRSRAVEVLGRIATESAVLSLIDTAQDSSTLVRWHVALALGKTKNPNVIATLELLRGDAGRLQINGGMALSVSAAAERSLAEIRGESERGAQLPKAPIRFEAIEILQKFNAGEFFEPAKPDGSIAFQFPGTPREHGTPFLLRAGKKYRFHFENHFNLEGAVFDIQGRKPSFLARTSLHNKEQKWLALLGMVRGDQPHEFFLGGTISIGTIYTARESGPLACRINHAKLAPKKIDGFGILRVLELDLPDDATIARQHGMEIN